MSAEQRAKLAAAQLAYVAYNLSAVGRHRQKLAEAQIARRMTLFPEEIAIIVALRRKGRTLTYIAEEIGIARESDETRAECRQAVAAAHGDGATAGARCLRR